MALSTTQMRRMAANAYDGIYWKHKVWYEMTDEQATAVYYSLKKQGKLKYKRNKKKKEPVYEQIMLEDWISFNKE